MMRATFSSSSSTRDAWWTRAAIVIAAAAVTTRLAAVAVASAHGFAQIERFEYETIASNLLAGRGFGLEHLGVWYRSFGSPPYSLLCAGLYRVFGHSPWIVLVVQAALSAVTVLACYSLGRRLFSPAAGLIAAIFVAWHPGLFYYDTHKLHPLGLDAALAAAGMWMVLRLCERALPPHHRFSHGGSRSMALLAGALHGLSILERTTQLLLLPLAAWALSRQPRGGTRSARLAAYVLGLALVIGPWVIRNVIVYGGRPVLITTMGREVFWIGNHAQASGGAFADGRPGVSVFEAAPEAFRQEILSRDELGQSQRFRQEAWSYVSHHPREALGLFLRKLRIFAWCSPQTGALYPLRYLVMYKMYYGIMLLLALIGMLIGRTADPEQRLAQGIVLAFIASVALAQAVFYVEIRHRWGIEPLLLIFSAGSLTWLLSRARAWAQPAESTGLIKICRIVTRLNIGGPSLHVAILSTKLDPRRFSTCLVVGQPEASEGDLSDAVSGEGIRMIRVNSLRRRLAPWGDLTAFAALLRIIWQERPQIIHTHMAKAGSLGRLAGLLYNTVGPGRASAQARATLIHTFHGHVLEGYFSPAMSRVFVTIERWLARRTDCLIAVSETIRDELLGKGLGIPKQWRVIPLGLDLSMFARLPMPEASDLVRIGIVGRLVPIKNPGLFLEALHQTIRQNGESIRGVVVGDGPLRAEMERRVAQLGLQPHVRFTGWRIDRAAVYAELDATCLTSWNEGTPVSLIEAMAAGRAVVATDVGGVREVLGGSRQGPSAISPGTFWIAERGIVVRPGDPAGLSAALSTVAHDPALRGRLGQAARAYVIHQFGQERLIADMTALYGSLRPQEGTR